MVITFEWNSLVSGVIAKLTLPGGKASASFRMSLVRHYNFKHQLALSRLFAMHADKQLGNAKGIHKNDRPQSQFWNRHQILFDEKKLNTKLSLLVTVAQPFSLSILHRLTYLSLVMYLDSRLLVYFAIKNKKQTKQKQNIAGLKVKFKVF